MEQMMVSGKVLITCMTTQFLAIIGVYIWTFKIYRSSNEKIANLYAKTSEELSKIYNVVNGHLQDADIHTDKDEFVKKDVCKVVHENVSKTLDEIKLDIKSLLPKT